STSTTPTTRRACTARAGPARWRRPRTCSRSPSAPASRPTRRRPLRPPEARSRELTDPDASHQLDELAGAADRLHGRRRHVAQGEAAEPGVDVGPRSEEHTSELQSLAYLV